jgi:hypothetical protein
MDTYSNASVDAITLLESPSPTTSSAAATCEQCGKHFARREGSGGSPQRFCSAQCRQASHTNGQHSQRSPACDAATEQAATPIADPVRAATEACEAQIAALLEKEREDRFDWFAEELVLEDQRPVAIYYNKRNHLVIRQEGRDGDEDAFVFIAPQNIAAFIDNLRNMAGLLKAGRK